MLEDLIFILGIILTIELVAIIETWYWVMKLKDKILKGGK